jgi:hypothetical protein
MAKVARGGGADERPYRDVVIALDGYRLRMRRRDSRASSAHPHHRNLNERRHSSPGWLSTTSVRAYDARRRPPKRDRATRRARPNAHQVVNVTVALALARAAGTRGLRAAARIALRSELGGAAVLSACGRSSWRCGADQRPVRLRGLRSIGVEGVLTPAEQQGLFRERPDVPGSTGPKPTCRSSTKPTPARHR